MPEAIPILEANSSLNGRHAAPVVEFHGLPPRLEFLDRVAAEGVIPHDLAALAQDVWQTAWQESGNRLSRPATTAGEGGPVGFNWDRGEHHLEAEIPRDGPVEWFYLNRTTDETWEADQPAGAPLPPNSSKYFERIAVASGS